MRGLIDLVADNPRIVPVAICTVLLLMLLRSMVRAFQRWEILPDPLFPEWVRKIWYAVEKRFEDGLYRGLSGRKPD
ncbi:MAG: hypothetical protein ACXVJT_17150 [Thermoanaerobaculia bacterium]